MWERVLGLLTLVFASSKELHEGSPMVLCVMLVIFMVCANVICVIV